jgi:hypothetical protein
MQFPSAMLLSLSVAALSAPAAKAIVRSNTSPPRIHVRLCNLAGLDTSTLAHAETEAGLILRFSRIDSDWKASCSPDESRPPDGLTRSSATPTEALGAPSLRLNIVAGAPPPPLGQDALGMATLFTRHGLHASIFADQIKALCDSRVNRNNRWQQISFAKLLGHVFAHEIGHLLLGSTEHCATGLMRAHWQDLELQQMACAHLTFTKEEAESMREHLLHWQHR